MDVGRLINELIEREGGYVDHPSDRGGPTNWGITENRARAEGFFGDMRALPRSTAFVIYKEDYYTGPGFDRVAAVLPKLGEELFDTGVNMGPGVAAKFLQRALNVLNNRASVYPDLIVDGKIGKMTVYSLNSLVQKRGRDNSERVLLRCVDALQAVRYIELAEGRETQEDFLYGWILNRVGVQDD